MLKWKDLPPDSTASRAQGGNRCQTLIGPIQWKLDGPAPLGGRLNPSRFRWRDEGLRALLLSPWHPPARVAEQADARDLKSLDRKVIRVQFPSRAPSLFSRIPSRDFATMRRSQGRWSALNAAGKHGSHSSEHGLGCAATNFSSVLLPVSDFAHFV